jgi:hypothetical protein
MMLRIYKGQKISGGNKIIIHSSESRKPLKERLEISTFFLYRLLVLLMRL